jgi:ADP-ribose pyrophosphatase
LGRWGENPAADPVITRVNPRTHRLEVLVVLRRDGGGWALPGGMVEEGELATRAAAREFKEEAGLDLDMSGAAVLGRAYVEDPRNTDNAWIVTTVAHQHVPDALARSMKPRAGDDAAAARWMDLTGAGLSTLYAGHGELVRRALRSFSGSGVSSDVRAQIKEALG